MKEEGNRGATQEFAKSVLIPRDQAFRFRDSLLRILQLVELEESDRVQQEDIKNVYQLLECIIENEKK